MRDVPARFSKVTSRMKSPKGKDPDNYVAKTAAALFPEMRQHGFTKKLCLSNTVVSPNLQHDVRAACGAILFDPLDALVGSTGYGANFTQNLVGDSFGRCFASAFFHGVGNGLKLRESQTRTFEKHVRGSLYILHFIGEIHSCLSRRVSGGRALFQQCICEESPEPCARPTSMQGRRRRIPYLDIQTHHL